MEITNNFERARKLTEGWPSWKRDYQLTKNSEARIAAQSTQAREQTIDESGVRQNGQAPAVAS